MPARPVRTAVGISCTRVSRYFGSTLALADVDLQIQRGESVGLLGPNGAGKSTLMALLAGVRRPDVGRVRIGGADPTQPRARRPIGVTPQTDALPQALRVREVVDLVRAHHDDPVDTAELTRLVGLDGLLGRQCGALSAGQRRRLSLALALAGRPTLLLLDEPTAGLDADSRDVVDEVVTRARGEGTTVVLSSHDLRDIERGCERVVVLRAGRIVADDDLESFRGRVPVRHVSVRTCADRRDLRALPGVVKLSPGNPARLASVDSDATLRALLRLDPGASDVLIGNPGLEDSLRTMLREPEAGPEPRAGAGAMSMTWPTRGPTTGRRSAVEDARGADQSRRRHDRAASPTGPRAGHLIGAHARAQALMLLRSPAQLLFLLLAPAVALLAIVSPLPGLAADPVQASQAFAQMAVLGALSVSVFGLGINAAEERASPWSVFVRTLPVSGWTITASRLVVTIAVVAGAMIPLTLAAMTTTALPQALLVGPWAGARLLTAALVAIIGCVPFLGIALFIGCSFTPATTVALTQVVVAPLAFAGGLVIPPQLFPSWLAQLSLLTPARPVRDAVLGALGGELPGWGAAAVWVAWSVAALAAAVRAYVRDEGRRFR